MSKATVYKTDGTNYTLDHRPTLEEAQKIVGGYIEMVNVGHGKTLVVDEEGRLKSKEINAEGCKLYPGVIVGDIIVLEGWRNVG